MAVQAVVRAFDIFKLIARHPHGIGVTEIARRTALHKSTVSRLISTLEGVEAVERRPDGGQYQVSTEFLSLFTLTNYPHTLLALARPYMLELSAATNEDVGLAIPDGEYAFFIDQVQSDQAVQVRNWTGSRLPLHMISAGKVFLAHQAKTTRLHYLSRPLQAYTPRTITDPDHLEQELTMVRTQGYAWIIEEFVEGLNAVAAPIFDAQGQVVAAICIYGPSFRFPPSEQRPRIDDLIVNFSQKVTDQLQRP